MRRISYTRFRWVLRFFFHNASIISFVPHTTTLNVSLERWTRLNTYINDVIISKNGRTWSSHYNELSASLKDVNIISLLSLLSVLVYAERTIGTISAGGCVRSPQSTWNILLRTAILGFWRTNGKKVDARLINQTATNIAIIFHQQHWLDANTRLSRQLKENKDIYELYFSVKFYAVDPCKLVEEITRYQFYLQLKQDVLQGRLPVTFDLASQLGAYVIQCK